MEYEVGWFVHGTKDETLFRIYNYTNALPGSQAWVSLRSLGEHLGWGRKKGPREGWTSATICDRWPTWERLLKAFRWPSALRRSIGNADSATAEKATETPCCNWAGLLAILCREAYGLRVRDAPATSNPGAAPQLAGILRRYIRDTTFMIALDAKHAVSAAGSCQGRNACAITIMAGGTVLFDSLSHIVLDSPGDIRNAGLDVGALKDLLLRSNLLDLLRELSNEQLDATSTCLLSQLLWHVGLIIEKRIQEEQAELEKGRPPKLPEVHHVADGERGKRTNQRALRYLKGGKEASRGARILSVGLDASRIGTRKRMQLAACVPRRAAWWLPTKVLP